VRNIVNISRIANNSKHINVVRKGLLLLFPLIIINSFAQFMMSFPSPAYHKFMTDKFGTEWINVFEGFSAISGSIISVALVVTISHAMMSSDSIRDIAPITPVIPTVVCLMSFFALAFDITDEVLSFPMGYEAIFLGILTSIVSTKLFAFFYRHMRKGFGYIRLDTDPVIPQVILAIIPAFITVLFFYIIRFAIFKAGFTNANEVLYSVIYKLFELTANSLFKLVMLILMIQVLWFFGIHGNMALIPVISELLPNMPENVTNLLVSASETVEPEVLIKTFIDVFVLIGGSGATLCLLIAIFITARRTNTVGLAKISLIPAIFNINEIVVFGMPIILNPFMFVPFLLTPAVMLLISYLVISLGIVPRISTQVVWSAPPLINAYLACGSIRGILLQLFNIAVGTLIYMPFVRLHEKQIKTSLNQTYEKLLQLLGEKQYGTKLLMMQRNDSLGYLAIKLAKDIEEAIINNEFTLEYQPLMDDEDGIIGFEALLRWTHKTFGRIPPLVVTSIAEEAGSINDLGRWVIRNACRQLAEWNRQGLQGIRMSINISPTQMQDTTLADTFRQCISEYGVRASDIEIEITENIVMELDEKTKLNINKLKSQGVRLAMDDFGMGYTSLLYIRHCNIDTIKIDGSITRDILKDKNCQDIVSSMVYLCNSMNIKVIAEYVEEKPQYELLKSLGCSEYQGFLFGPPLPPEEAIKYFSVV